MNNRFKSFIHPSLRPIVAGIAVFALCNLILTIGITASPLNRKFNFSYGNFLPVKLEKLRAHQPGHLDVLFLGTSQTNNGFITSTFETAARQRLQSRTPGAERLNSFNLGLPNNRYDVMLGTLRLQMHRYGKPRLLLVELSPSIQEENSSSYYLPALYYRTLLENDPALAPEQLGNPLVGWNVKQELLLSSLSSLRQYRFTFSPLNIVSKATEKAGALVSRFHPASADAAIPGSTSNPPAGNALSGNGPNPADDSAHIDDPATYPPEMTAKGWYPKGRSVHMTTPEGLAQSMAEARKFYIDSQKDINFNKLAALLAYCRQQGIPVVLVSWPNHPAYLKVFRQSRLQPQYQEGLRALLQKEPVPVLDLNQALPPGQREDQAGLFADPRHLTPEGADYFSRRLADELFALPEVRALFKPSPMG